MTEYRRPSSEYRLPTWANILTSFVAPQRREQRLYRTDFRARVQDDSDDDSEMWKMYLDEVEEEDKRFTNAWKEDANSIVTFTGLFSAIVGAFIIEFHKKLSSDSGYQTVALLQQISRQLPNSPNSTNSNTANQPPSPGTAMVWANAMWLISLVLSLTCALIATLLQQWARRYIETPKRPDVPKHRARVRSLLLSGTELYKIPYIVEMLPTLLHLSVYLFLAGLVIAFHTIHKKVAIAVDVAVGVSGLAYIALSILPCLDVGCPYRTPLSQILWYPIRVFPVFAALGLIGCSRPFLSYGQLYRLIEWVVSRVGSEPGATPVMYGLEFSIVNRAIETRKDGDHSDLSRVKWMFDYLALGDRKMFLNFAASIPRHKIRDLILPVQSDPYLTEVREYHRTLLQGPLLTLLRSSLAGIGEVDVNRRSLLACLLAIRRIAENFIPFSDLEFMRTHFAYTDLMKDLWKYDSTAIRVTSRSICALIAKQAARNPLRGPQLRWLQEAIGDVPHTTDVAPWDRTNLKSFINKVLTNQEDDLPTEDATSFKETLAILLGVRTDDDFDTNFESRLSAEVQRMREDGSATNDNVVDKLHAMFPFLLETPAPPTHPPSHATATPAAPTRGSTLVTATSSAPTPATSAPAASSHVASTSAASTSAVSTPAASPAASLHHDPLARV